MTCLTCRNWTAPQARETRGPRGTSKTAPGTCDLDKNPAHPFYQCKRYAPRAVAAEDIPDPNKLGLTPREVAWLHKHRAESRPAQALIRVYQMVVDCPNDPGARGIFAGMLETWRRERKPAAKADNAAP